MTLQDAVYNRMINDLAFCYTPRFLSMVEHQSTWSENMPLREFLYLGRIYEKILDNCSAYREGLYRIPTPHLNVLYNGAADRPLETVQHLADSFYVQEEMPRMDLAVTVININYHKKHPILKRSKRLREYARFTEMVRGNIRCGMNRDESIQSAIRRCVKEGILETFLVKHGSEVFNMLFTEVTDEDIMQIRVEEATEVKERQIVTNMLIKRMPIKEIHEIAEVPIDQILQIKAELKM